MKARFFIRLAGLLAAVLIASSDAIGRDDQKLLVGKVTRVSDGDTIWVRDRLGQRHKVRLNRIDAPESDQPFGKESTLHLQSIVGNKEVTVEYETHDRYGRILGIIRLGDEDVNLQMVRDGYAWHYRHFDNTPSYAAAESEARTAKRGLWATPAPIPPHQWRRRKR
ncbi:MAG: thermonuclease family protein [Kiritimatiellae bacterium]|nr:thermonuclease family protein [Kiritimatiellia bacterium]